MLARYEPPGTSRVGAKSKGQMALFPSIITHKSRGWFRVWLLLALVWAGYASTIVTWPWQLQRQLVASEIYPVDDSVTPVLNEHDARVKGICQSGSISIERESYPQMRATGQRLGFDGEIALQRVEASGQRVAVRTIPDPQTAVRAKVLAQRLGLDGAVATGSSDVLVKEWIFPATRQVSAFCFPNGAKTRSMVKALGILLVIPIGIAIAILTATAILSALWRWLADGFGYAQPPTTLSDGNVQAADAAGPGVPSGTISTSDRITKPLLWSVAIATVGDIFARGSLGHDRATGTNMLAFGTLALTIHLVLTALGDRVAERKKGPFAILFFWLAAPLILLVSVARYL